MSSLQAMGTLTISLLAACISIMMIVIVFKPASKKLMILAGLTLTLMIVITVLAVIMDLQMASSIATLTIGQ